MKVTRPPAPWMNSDQIRKLQVEREKLGLEAYEKNTDDSWDPFGEVRNKLKSAINKSKRSFITNALSSKRLFFMKSKLEHTLRKLKASVLKSICDSFAI